MLKLKRVYDKWTAREGRRILVDRLWPRGLGREEVGIDEWARELAPSDGLRKWFGHDLERWEEFRCRYTAELAAPEKQKALADIAKEATSSDVTLVFAARDAEHSNARVLEGIVRGLMARGAS